MGTPLAPSVTHRDPKGRKFASIVETAYDKAGLSDDEAQRVNEAEGLNEVIANFIAKHRLPNQFADEERTSSYGYFSGYQPKSLSEQNNRLHELFPGLGQPNQDLLTRIENGEVPLPSEAEGWGLIPNPLKRQDIFGPTYNDAMQKVLDTINQTRNGKFYNYCTGQLGPQYLRQSARKEKFFRELVEAQGNPDVLIVPIQFGKRHAGRSVRRAIEVLLDNEFGLGAFEVGIMLLTHPERLQDYNDLWVHCAGDEFALAADGRFSRAPFFGFGGDGVEFVAYDVGHARERCGSASAFLPQ